eukprot:CAMPEP_0185788526 /NCGR_PEP_ID=MMETSP1174-20130828/146558_1 /TAXON_ID=35687 /ORGANISM="Dictyocha speculum, Strain CCMP1381" /LENGTH=52 /DNA_ID=CAMNT_0028482257 /DNA_START=517 /DNA_END=675 /DNA_ORIENTATION=+
MVQRAIGGFVLAEEAAEEVRRNIEDRRGCDKLPLVDRTVPVKIEQIKGRYQK